MRPGGKRTEAGSAAAAAPSAGQAKPIRKGAAAVASAPKAAGSGRGRGAAAAMAARLGWDGAWSGGQERSRKALTDYTVYALNGKELLLFVAAGYAAVFACIYIFYRSAPLAAMVSLIGLAAPRVGRSMLLARRKLRLKLQFKEALFALASSLAAGRSIENAFRSALDDLQLLYTDPRCDILRELAVICRRLDNGEPLEGALRNFAERSGIEEIAQFADVVGACKRSGGDLIEVMKRTSTIIGEKLGVEAEIMVMIARKRLEARVMMAVPFAFLGFLSFAAPDYMAPLYSGTGYLLLTGALLLLFGCYWAMAQIMTIEM